MQIEIKRLPSCFDQEPIIPLPEYKTQGASGFDLQSTIEITVWPGMRESIPTGISVAFPEGFDLQVRPRSGLAMKHGITILNTPGTVDSDYRGELIVILFNTSQNTFFIARGDRIAQAVVVPVVRVSFKEVDELTVTQRGEKGFGSTGV